jgi:hypothetical protein
MSTMVRTTSGGPKMPTRTEPMLSGNVMALLLAGPDPA